MIEAAVLITEIAWMGSVSLTEVQANQQWRHEWLELFSSRQLSLEGWELELYQGGELYFEIPLRGSIAEQGYFVIAASDNVPEADFNYQNLGGKFVNEGMRVVLKDGLGNTVDELDAREGWPAGSNDTKRTMELGEEGWQDSAQPGGTPGAKNSGGFTAPEPFSFGNEKDPAGSPSLTSGTTLLALAVALGSALSVLGLSRALRPQS